MLAPHPHPHPRARVAALTTLAMVAFAGNSLLCRIALRETVIDPASFTSIRLLSGAVVLMMIVAISRQKREGRGDNGSALALFIYAAAFSFAYVSLSAATGALLLFGAVQATMIAVGLCRGERLALLQVLGLLLALAGLFGLLLPGLTAPPLAGSVLMLLAGAAWGVYSLRGRGGGDPLRVTAGNFLRAVPVAVLLGVLMPGHLSFDRTGVVLAIVSGALTSGIGYAVWYAVLPALKAALAATVQLSVPVIAAIGGIVLLGEAASLRLLLASGAILGGIALVIGGKSKSVASSPDDRP
jgi:drug/metabolite transporter (DMT)-like permease